MTANKETNARPEKEAGLDYTLIAELAELLHGQSETILVIDLHKGAICGEQKELT